MIGYPFLELGVKVFLRLPPDHITVLGGRVQGMLGQQAVSVLGSIAFTDQQNGAWDVW